MYAFVVATATSTPAFINNTLSDSLAIVEFYKLKIAKVSALFFLANLIAAIVSAVSPD